MSVGWSLGAILRLRRKRRGRKTALLFEPGAVHSVPRESQRGLSPLCDIPGPLGPWESRPGTTRSYARAYFTGRHPIALSLRRKTLHCGGMTATLCPHLYSIDYLSSTRTKAGNSSMCWRITIYPMNPGRVGEIDTRVPRYK